MRWASRTSPEGWYKHATLFHPRHDGVAGIDTKARRGGRTNGRTGAEPRRGRLLVAAQGALFDRVRALLDGPLASEWTAVYAIVPELAAGQDEPDVALVDVTLPDTDPLVQALESGGVPWIALGAPARSRAVGLIEPDELNASSLRWALRYACEHARPAALDDDRTARMLLAGEVAASVAHEINNPLTYLLANLEHVEQELSQRSCAPDLLDAVSEAREGADRLSWIVGELGKVTRAPSTRVEPVYLDRLFDSVLTMAKPHVRGRARSTAHCEVLHPVAGNEARLFQVLLNLVINAAQALDPSRDDHEIRVGARWTDDRRIELYVTDTGVGIPPENLARIFEPYFTTKSARKGTGLGLALCRRYVEQMGGTIDVVSEVGVGSTFRVVLPPARGSGDRPTLVPDYDARVARILLVDDEQYIGRAFARALAGHEITIAESAEEALERLAEAPFDVVFTDIVMPGMSGIDLFRRIRADHPRLAPRVVFFTGGALDRGAASFLETIENPRFQKPVGVQQLRDIVTAVLRQG